MEYFKESVIIEMVEAMLPKFSPKNIILTFGLKFDWSHYSENGEENKQFIKKFLVAIHRPDNYTKVMVKELSEKETFFHSITKDSELEFNLESDHDSCWRSDGFQFIFNGWIEAEEYFGQFNLDIRKPQDISTFHGFDSFGGRPKIWKIEMPRIIDRESRKLKIKFLNEMKLVAVDKDSKPASTGNPGDVGH